MTLGTTWAVRGQFGHEQGAAWAGSIAALAILMLSKRADWNAKFLKITLAAAVGWGLGGMMSYGIVVGYGKGVDFINVYYGLTMLFVIGGLYGFIGGGLFGLALLNSEENRVDWLLVATKMLAGGTIAYFFLIAQWEFLMTPPRSELWAACLGMAIALAIILNTESRKAALRVAVYAGLGGGFGFGFGNFLQVMGNHAEIAFNFWNVMEYSLGFFGGIGMAYGTFTAHWPKTKAVSNTTGHLGAFLMLSLFIPLVIWKETFTFKKLNKIYQNLEIASIATPIQLLVLAAILIFTIYFGRQFFGKKRSQIAFSDKEVAQFFKSSFLFYILLSLTLTGAFFSTYRIEQYLYLLNYALILFWAPRLLVVFEPAKDTAYNWGKLLLICLVVLGLCTVVVLQFNEVFEGMHRRFEG
jgi:hypothetical protein